jgi:hypothetical protein
MKDCSAHSRSKLLSAAQLAQRTIQKIGLQQILAVSEPRHSRLYFSEKLTKEKCHIKFYKTRTILEYLFCFSQLEARVGGIRKSRKCEDASPSLTTNGKLLSSPSLVISSDSPLAMGRQLF